jgi:lipoprotein NlpD
MKIYNLVAVVMISAMVTSGCSTTGSNTTVRSNVSASSRVDSNHYVVKRGDTLFSIAFANGLDYRTLALINKLDPVNAVIHPGDILLVKIKNLNVKNVYRVKSGDTLYNVAKRYKKSVEYMARINHIQPPYAINAGQLLIIDDRKPTFSPAVRSNSSVHQTSASGQPSVSGEVTTAASVPISPLKNPQQITSQKSAYNSRSKLTWQWPTYGTIVKKFSSGGASGINIAGKKGQNIKAAAEGKVVYAGNALRGYGNLIIIKHNDDYISAYAHNDRILVKERDLVKSGQVIGRMGDTDSNMVNLHFEIRYRGQSVNPQNYLPRQ